MYYNEPEKYLTSLIWLKARKSCPVILISSQSPVLQKLISQIQVSFSPMTKVINNSFFLGINFYFCVETGSALGGLCVRQTAPTIRIDGAGAGTLVGNCRTEANIARAPDHWCWAKIVVG